MAIEPGLGQHGMMSYGFAIFCPQFFLMPEFLHMATMLSREEGKDLPIRKFSCTGRI
jgi:hypothetical protein